MIQEKLRSLIESKGFSEFGFAPLRQPLSLDHYRHWIESGQHGEMKYLERHLSIKEKPESKYPEMHSAIVFRVPYHRQKNAMRPLPALRVAIYARQKDYHLTLQSDFSDLVDTLRGAYPDERFHFHTDSSPILERDLAYQAGLGWFGKNSCLIDQKTGSLFFIAEILTSLKLNRAEVFHPDRCGQCQRCVEICPTDAIDGEKRQVDARLCISYLNIEKKGVPPAELRNKMGDWFFGCDLCQTVCPWNEKVFGKSEMEAERQGLPDVSNGLTENLRWILGATSEEINDLLKDFPLTRPKANGLKRNAIVVATNRGLDELKPDITKLLHDPQLGELAAWSLEEL